MDSIVVQGIFFDEGLLEAAGRTDPAIQKKVAAGSKSPEPEMARSLCTYQQCLAPYAVAGRKSLLATLFLARHCKAFTKASRLVAIKQCRDKCAPVQACRMMRVQFLVRRKTGRIVNSLPPPDSRGKQRKEPWHVSTSLRCGLEADRSYRQCSKPWMARSRPRGITLWPLLQSSTSMSFWVHENLLEWDGAPKLRRPLHRFAPSFSKFVSLTLTLAEQFAGRRQALIQMPNEPPQEEDPCRGLMVPNRAL